MKASPSDPSALTILVVDDEATIRKTVSVCLETEGHKVVSVSNSADALAEAALSFFDLAFVDIRLGTSSGLDLLPPLLASSPWLKIVIITAYASIETAVDAMRRGASDYIPKPFTPAQVKLAVHKVAELKRLEGRVAALQEELEHSHPELTFSSLSPAMNRAIHIARQVAPTDATVLLRGESGTGKTALARAIHQWSQRTARQISIVSCPSLSSELLESELFGHVKGAFTGAVRDNPGRIASSEGGTLLLDEIGDLPLSVQPKLLRFLQDREYERVGDSHTRKADVRILAATNTDLEESVAQGHFREDLLYRLNVIQIEIPPLRERQEDLLDLAESMLLFFGRLNHKRLGGYTEEARAAILNYEWPGNLRELRNLCERAAILCQSEYVGIEHLSDKMKTAEPTLRIGDPVSLASIEEGHIRRVLASTKSLQEAAEVLGIDQATLWRRRKQYGI
ncbi:MAG: sigma-54 dependent transcriptional regulator [Thermodesulfobacteriota bacterium]